MVGGVVLFGAPILAASAMTNPRRAIRVGSYAGFMVTAAYWDVGLAGGHRF